jgi:hypothetical protein
MLGFSYGNAQILDSDSMDLDKPETEMTPEIFWAVKAFRPEVQFLDVKAIDKYGRRHDVKAIQDSDDTSMLSVKAIVDGMRLPIKLIANSGEKFYPVKAIDAKGNLIDIKAITEKGEILDVKGFSRSGNIIHLKAITKDHKNYNIISISPDSKVNSVKGIKMMEQEVEATLLGVEIFAHVKSLSQD